MDILYEPWQSSTEIGQGISIKGNSVAGVRTSFYIPQFKILLDAGNQNFNNVEPQVNPAPKASKIIK